MARLPTRYNADLGLYVINGNRWMLPADDIRCVPGRGLAPGMTPELVVNCEWECLNEAALRSGKERNPPWIEAHPHLDMISDICLSAEQL